MSSPSTCEPELHWQLLPALQQLGMLRHKGCRMRAKPATYCASSAAATAATAPPPRRGNFQHWGSAGPGLLEPNNLVPQENCAGSNLSTSYTNAGGWADHHCKEK